MVLLNVVLILLLGRTVSTYQYKIYYSKWIRAHQNLDNNVYVFDIALKQSVDSCVQLCKAKKMCSSINLHRRSNTCYLVGVNNTAINIDDYIEINPGFILLKKSDWNLDEYSVCDGCEPRGVCRGVNQVSEEYSICRNSGCGPPAEFQFAEVLGNMYSIANKIKYKCMNGFKNIRNGSDVTTCDDNGNWTPVDIRCLPGLLGSAYIVIETPKSWDEAKQHCESLGAYLADVKTEQEWNFLIDNVSQPDSNTFIWLGGSDQGIEGTFKWLDGTPFTDGFTVWGHEQPNNEDNKITGAQADCVAYGRVGDPVHAWYDNTCSTPYWSLCEFSVL